MCNRSPLHNNILLKANVKLNTETNKMKKDKSVPPKTCCRNIFGQKGVFLSIHNTLQTEALTFWLTVTKFCSQFHDFMLGQLQRFTEQGLPDSGGDIVIESINLFLTQRLSVKNHETSSASLTKPEH